MRSQHTRNILETPASSTEVVRQRAYSVARQFRVLFTMRPRQVGSLLARAYADWASDSAGRLGAALAYFTLFSIAPILIVLTGVVGLFIGEAAARGQVAPWLEQLLSPEGARAAELMLKRAATPSGGIITTAGGLFTLFLGTSALVNELRSSLNVVWRVQAPASDTAGILASLRSMMSDRLYGFLVVVGAGLCLLASLVLNTVVTATATYFDGWLPLPVGFLQIVNFVVNFAWMSAMFTLVYKFVPDAYVSWGDACVGALITAFLFTLGAMALTMFVGVAGGQSVYGTAASVLAMLMWVYYSSQVFFFGAEVTRIFANEYGARIVPRHRSLIPTAFSRGQASLVGRLHRDSHPQHM
ncbi:MAG TPA: YihY/virulence factor BrkB family protein [Vicinamibacterales bacterium]|nr:YihY/virulence factor BrkB family protein [Vicinamibacterales bacterium]